MIELLSFQVELEQLVEDLKHASLDVASANRHFTGIGRYLLIGQEFLTPDEYQAALCYCGLTGNDAVFCIEVCQYTCIFRPR
jgi:hypothetical protein